MPDTPATHNPLVRAVVGIVSDLHVGSTVGLCPPDGVELEDGGLYKPNDFQKWEWDQWCEMWAWGSSWSRGWPLVTKVNGEFIDGNHHGTTQIVTPSTEIMAKAALDVWAPVKALAPYKTYVTKGTAAHVGAGGASDDLVAALLGAEKDPETKQSAFYHLMVTIAGVYFDVAHHVSGTARMWTHGNNIRTEVLEVMDDAAQAGERAPDYVLRAHVHKFADTGLNYPTRGLVTPAWQGLTEFTHRITRRVNRTVGGIWIKCENGESEMKLWKQTLKRPKPLIA